MNFLNFNLKKALIVGLIALLPLLSINMEQKSTQNAWFAQPLGFVADVFQSFFSGISKDVRGTTSYYVNLLGVKSENETLRKQNAELMARLSTSEETQNEINRLKELLEFKKTTKMNLLAAQIIGRDLVPDHATITINKGTKDGVKELQAAITKNGAIGYVLKADHSTSHVMLMTDRYSIIDAIIQKNRARAIIEGLGKNKARLEYVSHNDFPAIGDIIVTGGLDNIFPKGFPVAVVSEIKKNAFKTNSSITVEPIINIEKIEELFIVTNSAGEDYLAAEPEKHAQ